MRVINNNGYLMLDAATQVGPTPNRSGKISSIEFIVNHYTAGGYPVDSSVKSMLDPNAKRSAHLFVDYDGSVTQLASLDDKLWHAGESKWENRQYLNGYSIGIEFANPGLLSLNNGVYITYYGKAIPDHMTQSGLIPHTDRIGYWCKYTEDQMLVAHDIHRALIDYFPSIHGIVGHSDISPGRKMDPGPAFPIQSLQALLSNLKSAIQEKDTASIDDVSTVTLKTTAAVNLRKLPSTGSNILITIPDGSVVTGTDTGDGWYSVSFTSKTGAMLHGYISAKYASIHK